MLIVAMSRLGVLAASIATDRVEPMSAHRSRQVRLSDRRGSIGVAILMAVSLSLLGAQAASGTRGYEAGPSPEASAARS